MTVRGGTTSRPRDDSGGVWTTVGLIAGGIFYAGMVVMLFAGFTAILPFVVIPLVIVGLIGANSLLGGPRRPERPPPKPIRPDEPDNESSSPGEGKSGTGG